MQQLNALWGGTIYADVEKEDPQDLQSVPNGTALGEQDGSSSILAHSQKRGGTTHPIHILKETHLRRILQRDSAEVNTRHLQAVATVGDGLRVSAVAPDGVIEAIEDESGLRIGVQFHPERSFSQFEPLFTYLIDRSMENAASHQPA